MMITEKRVIEYLGSLDCLYLQKRPLISLNLELQAAVVESIGISEISLSPSRMIVLISDAWFPHYYSFVHTIM
jgi:hypothetical protein